jgi:hypothetical protein
MIVLRSRDRAFVTMHPHADFTHAVAAIELQISRDGTMSRHCHIRRVFVDRQAPRIGHAAISRT